MIWLVLQFFNIHQNSEVDQVDLDLRFCRQNETFIQKLWWVAVLIITFMNGKSCGEFFQIFINSEKCLIFRGSEPDTSKTQPAPNLFADVLKTLF